MACHPRGRRRARPAPGIESHLPENHAFPFIGPAGGFLNVARAVKQQIGALSSDDVGPGMTLHCTGLMKKTMRTAIFLFVWVGWLLSGRAGATPADEEYEELYGEEVLHVEERPAWKEGRVRLPPYPDAARAIPVDVDLGQSAYRVLIDPDSITVGEDSVVRYTLLLQSPGGTTNVFYEGLRCTAGQYRRYAYGVDGRFKLFPRSKWRYIRRVGMEKLHFSLAGDFFCPLPERDKVARLIRRLKRPNPKTDFADQE